MSFKKSGQAPIIEVLKDKQQPAKSHEPQPSKTPAQQPVSKPD